MKVLLTNDDGIHAQGLWALYNRFADAHHVSVVAPDRERSAIGHAISLNQPLRAIRVSPNGGYNGYEVNGTPADCVKLAMAELLSDRPDVVIAGINPGANVGANLNYSGTVAAAKEAALNGVIGIAVSIEGQVTEYYDEVARFVLQLCDIVTIKGLPFGTFLNVNIPSRAMSEITGVRISRQGTGLLSEYVSDTRPDREHFPMRNRIIAGLSTLNIAEIAVLAALRPERQARLRVHSRQPQAWSAGLSATTGEELD